MQVVVSPLDNLCVSSVRECLVTCVLLLTLEGTTLLVLIVLPCFLICISAGILVFQKMLFNNGSMLDKAGCIGQ